MTSGSFGFYGILTEPELGYEALADIMVQCGVRYIQLRMKRRPKDEIRQTAFRLREIIDGRSLFIINDDARLAKEVGADGVHIGQNDMPYEEARRIMGIGAVVGLSTHNLQQTKSAMRLDPLPDYIGVGPVFPTPTKQIPDPVIGLTGMKHMIEAAAVPAVAIGGIDLANIQNVVDSGARNACAVRCVNQSSDPAFVIQKFQRLLASVDK